MTLLLLFISAKTALSVILHERNISLSVSIYVVSILQNMSFSESFQCPIALALCQSKEYAVIRFHRHGVLAPDYAVISTQEVLLARNYKRAEQGYSFAFWLKNLQTCGSYFVSQRTNSPSLPPHAAVSTSKQNFDSR